MTGAYANPSSTFRKKNSSFARIQDDQIIWFETFLESMRQRILNMLGDLEIRGGYYSCYQPYAEATQKKTTWEKKRDPEWESGVTNNGGGEYTYLTGRVWEKATVNISNVNGRFPRDFIKDIPGARDSDGYYCARGLSTVIHPRSPHLPAIHMNMRFLTTSISWFGGCLDLNPMSPLEQSQANNFHSVLRDACEQFDPDCYSAFAKACDSYFQIPHRNQARGIGGIFFDYLPPLPDPKVLFEAMGESFISVYRNLSKALMDREWDDQDKTCQERYRGYYAEFNLAYDRGTRFGFKTSGNTEAILMALPPSAAWAAPNISP